jgi:hypothetical protein
MIAWLRQVEDEPDPDVDLTGEEFAVAGLEDDDVIDEGRPLTPLDFAPAVQTTLED